MMSIIVSESTYTLSLSERCLERVHGVTLQLSITTIAIRVLKGVLGSIPCRNPRNKN